MIKGNPSHAQVYLVDSHPAIREALRHRIDGTIDTTVRGEAGTADRAFREIEKLGPDVVITELSLPDRHGITLLQNVRAQCEDVRMIVFSMYHEDVYAERAVRSGAMGYVMKSEPTESIVRAIRAVQNGEVYLSDRISSRIITTISSGQSPKGSFPVDELTDREMVVFQLLGQGASVQEIQDQLSLTRKTVETHRRSARKTRTQNSLRASAVRGAVDLRRGHIRHVSYQNGTVFTEGRGTRIRWAIPPSTSGLKTVLQSLSAGGTGGPPAKCECPSSRDGISDSDVFPGSTLLSASEAPL